MSTRGSKLQSYLLEQFSRYRAFSTNDTQRRIPSVTVAKPRHGYSRHQGFHWISSNSGTGRKHDTNMCDQLDRVFIFWVKDDMNKVSDLPLPLPLPPAPTTPRFNFALWARWLLGTILSLLLPFWKQKWEKLQTIEGEAEMVVEEVENVAEVVEKVATVAEKVSAGVADVLPDHTKLKEVASLVERVSKETAHDAQITQNFIQKVDELKQDLDDLETLVEPIVDNIVRTA